MKKRSLIFFPYLLIFLFTAVASSRAQTQSNSSLDFSGMKQFWAIVDLLEKDAEPSEQQWNELFKTPGYSYLVNVEHKDKLFKKYFPLVFMPSKAAELQKELAAESHEAKYYLPHYLNVKAKRNEIEQFQSELEKQDLLKESLKRTAQYLPGDVMKKFPPPNIAFAIFEPDGHADPSIIVIDLLYATQADLTKFIGHEAHHYYLGKIIKTKDLNRDTDDYFLARSINQLRLEGMGDLIDKFDILDEAADRNLPASRQKYRADYRRLYYQSAEVFKQIDALISEIANDPAKLKENSKKVWDLLPYGAHPQGFFMSKTIVDNLGKAILIKEMANPFEFIRLYNRAAAKAAKEKKGEYYVFSDKTLSFLKQLEKKYQN